MNNKIVLIRMSNGKVTALMDGDYIATFDTYTETHKAMSENPLCKAMETQIVDLDEI